MRLTPKLLPFVLTLALAALGCESSDGDLSNNTGNNNGGRNAGDMLDVGNGGGGGGTTTNPDGGSTTGPSAPAGTIKALQEAAQAAGCDEEADFPVTVLESATVNSAVVTSPRFDVSSNLDGYYVWDDDQAPWSGIMITLPVSENSNFQPGDVLTLTGELEEAWCNTQLGIEAGGWELTGTTSAPPEPLAIDADAADFEPYEGMLVSVSDVLVEADAGGGRYTLEGGLEVDYGFDFFLTLEVGERYDLVGQVKYAWATYKLIPRTQDDITLLGQGAGADGGTTTTGDASGTSDAGPVPGTETTISALQQTDASLVCPEVSIVNITDNIVLEGYVTVAGFDVHETLNAYGLWSGEEDATTYSGIVVVVEKTMDEGWSMGQRLRVTGEHLEYYCMTEVRASAVEVLDGTGVSTPMVVTDFADNAEAYEGMVITIEDATVTSVDNFESYGEIETDGGFFVDDWILGDAGLTEAAVDDVYCSVTGLVSYAFGNYRLNPRTADDLTTCPDN